MMSKSIEMAERSLLKKYQQNQCLCSYCGKELYYTTLHYPEHKYLIGGVSISNQFSDFSKSLQ